jgi:hypothetical protein
MTIVRPQYAAAVLALPYPSPAMQAYIAAMQANDGTPAQVDAAQDAYQALSDEERLTLREISRGTS